MIAAGPDEIELREGAAALGVPLEEADVQRLLAFVERLYLWNRSSGLTTVDRGLAVRRHLLDSLAAAPEVADLGEVTDLGTGPGLPGIPLAIVFPRMLVTLVESKRRKCSFLREAVRVLGLANCRVLEADAQSVADEYGEVEAVIARAFLPPVELSRLASGVLAPGGRLIALTGPRADPTAMAAATGGVLSVSTVRNLQLPGSTERRRIVVLLRRP